MQRTFKRVALVVSALSCAAPAVMMAGRGDAVPPASHPGQMLAAAGSDTTYFAVRAIEQRYNNDSTVNTETPKDKTFDIPPLNTPPFPATYTVPADAHCAKTTYSTSNPGPDGSSAGIAALNADAASGHGGCIDWARSSRGRKSTDPSIDQFYAFALDALGYLTFPGTHAPANLTQQQMINIYTCNPSTGAPYISNWHQLNPSAPTNSVIKKYAPQTQAGTYSFFNSKILNGGTIDSNCNASHLSIFVEEHDATGVSAANKPNAIIPFSHAQFVAAANGVIPDRRNGGKEGKLNGLLPTTKTIIEGPGRFLGTRYVYNVANTQEPDYTDVMRFIGVDSTGPGFLCSNKAAGLISQYGEKPLSFSPTGGGIPINSYCRKDPADL
jgi:hypothetical protein